MKDILTLGIESSCDETSVSVVKNGREVLSNVINSQIDIHTEYGGVVPEIASRCHTEVINQITKQALKEANVTMKDIDVICPTYGPGLVGALLVGVSYAKGLAFANNKPLVGINHLEGHIAANYITYKDLKPPFLCLMMSGGNTQIVYVKDYCDFEVLGKTRDDAIGEAFDKVARVVGLGYPGGPKVDALAKEGVPNIELPKTHFDNLDFSFSGIKTAVINLNHKNPNINKADLCASFQKTVTEILIENINKAIEHVRNTVGGDAHIDPQTNTKSIANNVGANCVRPQKEPIKLVLAGGVSANSYIRNAFLGLQKEGVKIYMPDLKLCTDNAAMIASAGYYNYLAEKKSDLTLNAVPNLKL